MQLQKLSKTVTSTLTYIEDAILAQAEGNEEKVTQLTWRAAAGIEYGLFIFSLKHSKKPSSSWKLPKVKQPKIESLLAATKNILEEAAKSLEADDLKEAHKKMWIARGQLLRIHDFFEKKQKKT
jgi:hypothetical protein